MTTIENVTLAQIQELLADARAANDAEWQRIDAESISRAVERARERLRTST